MNLHQDWRSGNIIIGPVGYLAAFVLIGLLFVPSQVDSGNKSRAYRTRYATVFYEKQEDLFTFARQIGSGLNYLLESPEKDPLLAAKRVDRLVNDVMKILGMRPAVLRFSIDVYRTRAEIDRAYTYLINNRQPPAAYYDHASRTIAVSLDSVTDRVLAHEIAHAVICSYFAFPPPVKTQEILAQYVDRYLGE